MTETTDIEREPKSPAEAFEDLRREVALMRKVIERMADDQRAAPDYSETLGRMADGLITASKSLNWLTQRPIVKTTANEMALQIGEAGNLARAEDQRAIERAARTLNDTNRELSGWIATARNADDHERQLWRFTVGAAVSGAIIAIILTITCLRLFHEHSAAWLIGKDRGQSGQQLRDSTNLEKWSGRQESSKSNPTKRRTAIGD